MNAIEDLASSESSKVPPLEGFREAVNIRKATKGDCSRMMELIKELAEYEKAPDAVTVDFNHFVESGFGKKPVWWALVAELPLSSVLPLPSDLPLPSGKGQIIGFALWYKRYSTWKGQRLYLEDLLVTQEMRGKGIGKLLLDALIEEAKRQNFSGIMWQVLDWNEPAINFYKKYEQVNFDGEWVNCSISF